jgi:hypothetical protein
MHWKYKKELQIVFKIKIKLEGHSNIFFKIEIA